MRNNIPHILIVLFLTVLPSGILFAQGSYKGIKARAPVTNFRLPLFDSHNRLSTFIRADTATAVNDNQVDISGISITQYSYDNDRTSSFNPDATSLLTSPIASFFREEEEIHGPGSFLFKRNDLEVSGKQWKYFNREKKITIAEETHVIFRAPLPNLLK